MINYKFEKFGIKLDSIKILIDLTRIKYDSLGSYSCNKLQYF